MTPNQAQWEKPMQKTKSEGARRERTMRCSCVLGESEIRAELEASIIM